MLLNRVERAFVNHPVRFWMQRHLELPRMVGLGGCISGSRVLEVGCGRGKGVRLLLESLGAARVDAFDLDPAMVELARAELAGFGDRSRVWQGSVTAIDAPDAAYDAVFDFGILHHVPRWRDGLAEIHRVLAPGGRLFAEEALAEFILHPLWRRVLDHPLEDRFDRATFERALVERGFALLGSDAVGQSFAWFAAQKARDGRGLLPPGAERRG
ncbi:MAG: class I SAM-dependent methyltransferase [Polyangiaceae bacterium]|nr:class I SAM-dependent methyltransferase [Polyangiaceae bacterium]